MTTPLEHVAIMGLGIVGSLTALTILQRSSIARITVFEVRPAPATIGGALNISPNAHRALHNLGVSPKAYGGSTPWVLFQNEYGARIGEFKYGGHEDPWAGGFEGLRVIRSDVQHDLMRALKVYEDAGRLEVKFSRRAVRITEAVSGATIIFNDGDTIDVDLVIGGDGIHSFTRAQVLSLSGEANLLPKATYSGVTTIYGLVPSSRLPAQVLLPLDKHHSIRTISPHAGLFAVSYATHNRSHVHWFSSRAPPFPPSPDEEDPSPETIRAELLGTYGAFPEPIPQLIECTDKIYYWPVYRLDPVPRDWFSPLGRIVLVGDAAHAMPPHAAQGVGMGVEDAIIVGKIVTTLVTQSASSSFVKPSAALWRREYQERRAARVTHFIAHAEGQGKARQGNGWVHGRLREWGLWLTFPIVNWLSSLNWLVPDLQGWGYDPETEAISLEGL